MKKILQLLSIGKPTRVVQSVPTPKVEQTPPVELNPKPVTEKTLKGLKILLKWHASEIKRKRYLFREEQRKNLPRTVRIYEVLGHSQEFRHLHIAYCELRGRARDQIEKPHKDNLPDEKWIQEIKNEYGAQTLHPGT